MKTLIVLLRFQLQFNFDFSGIVWAGLCTLQMMIAVVLILVGIIVAAVRKRQTGIAMAKQSSIGVMDGGLVLLVFGGLGLFFGTAVHHEHDTREWLDVFSVPYSIVAVISCVVTSIARARSIQYANRPPEQNTAPRTASRTRRRR